MANVWNWNAAIETTEGRRLWGRRTVTYFVYDPRSRSFAPSKYCAFMAIESGNRAPVTGPMTMGLYGQLGESETRFDGHIARRHLGRRLAMRVEGLGSSNSVGMDFERWAVSKQMLSLCMQGVRGLSLDRLVALQAWEC